MLAYLKLEEPCEKRVEGKAREELRGRPENGMVSNTKEGVRAVMVDFFTTDVAKTASTPRCDNSLPIGRSQQSSCRVVSARIVFMTHLPMLYSKVGNELLHGRVERMQDLKRVYVSCMKQNKSSERQ